MIRHYIQALRGAYNAGWRAGRAGASYTVNPCNGPLLRLVWGEGWHNGIVQRLNRKAAGK